MRFYDLFGGVGGFRLGLEKEGNECVGYCDFDKHAVAIYNKRFNEQHKPTDVKTVGPTTLPDFDILCGGFPCQPFSLAGKRMGFADTRGTLFHDICRIAAVKRPRYLFLENVKGLLSHDGGHTFAVILSALDELGYDAEWQVLDSQHFGVPQHRERVFIIGHSRSQPTSQIFPIKPSGKEDTVVSTIAARTYQSTRAGTYIESNERGMIELTKNTPDAYRVYSTEGVIRTLKGESGGVGGKMGLILDAYNGGKQTEVAGAIRQNQLNGGSVIAIPVLTPDRNEKRQNGRRFKEDGEPAFTITAQDKHGIFNGQRIRRLTPTECERLQGFPDGWTAEASDSQRYKMLGNAVTVNVIEAIARRLK